MEEFILNHVKIFLNHPIFSYLIGVPLVEYSLSRWKKRPFSKRNVWTLFLFTYGVACILRGLYIVKAH